MATKKTSKKNPRRPVDEDPMDMGYLDEEVAEYIRDEAREDRQRREDEDTSTFDRSEMDPDEYGALVEWTYEKLKRPSDFGYGGDRDMFETWALGPVIETRDSKTITKANAIALTRHLEELTKKDESLVDEWEIARASHWAVGWVDHISFHAIDDRGNPTKMSAILKEWFDKLEDYPIADDDLLSEMEADAQGDDWENFYRDDFRAALERALGIWGDVDLDDFVTHDQLYELFRAGDDMVGGEGTEADPSHAAGAVVRLMQRAEPPVRASADLKKAIKNVEKAVKFAEKTKKTEAKPKPKKKPAKKSAKNPDLDDSTRAKRMMNPKNY